MNALFDQNCIGSKYLQPNSDERSNDATGIPRVIALSVDNLLADFL
jgi:hypothetical protein